MRSLPSVLPLSGYEVKLLDGAIGLVLSVQGHPAISATAIVRADFWEVGVDSNFSVFRDEQFTEWPGSLH